MVPSIGSSETMSTDTEVEAFRRLYPLEFYERHFDKSIRPDARPLRHSRDTTVAFGAVSSANGSALVKIGSTTMLAAIKMEIMTPSVEAPDEGNIAIEFHMPPICSPIVRPGRPAEAAPVISKQLADTILSAGMIDLKELCLVSGKAAWMAYLDICCLDADGGLFDAALLSAAAAFSHLQIPVVSLNEEGRVFIVSEEEAGKSKKEVVNKEKRKLNLKSIPLSLTCILHKNYIIPDPTAEEESIIETSVTVVMDSSDQLVSLYKPGGQILGFSKAIQECVELTRQRVKELLRILEEAVSDMEVD
ncbi:uncharacterized protein LOC141657229 [Silene latifolia]|uniref:uncharacterized protein LOC141657229 n=1 Tax=Silene latifolia TaxID=37657 RepID=UPI003D771C81